MKRLLSVLLILVVVFSLSGCGTDKGRLLYNLDLSDYVTIGDYKGLKIDTKSEEFEQTGTAYIINDIISNNFQSTESVKKGTVKMGDIANIDFVGTKDGVAFEGGTSKGYELTIGSGSFISGFEEGLVGKEIGSTVKLNLTFPEDYQSADLAGKDVVFTVTINSVWPAKTPEEFYTALGYNNVDDYYANVEKNVTEEILMQQVLENSSIEEYPKEDMDILMEHYYAIQKENIEYYYQCTMDEFLSGQGMTEEAYKESFINQFIKPLMKEQMVWYAILDKEEMSIKKEDTENKIKEMIANGSDSSATRADIIEEYGELYIENHVVAEKVIEFLKKNAKIS